MITWGRLLRGLEIAEGIGRAPITALRHLLHLQAAGRLERRHPAQPRHPGQVYRATEEITP